MASAQSKPNPGRQVRRHARAVFLGVALISIIVLVSTSGSWTLEQSGATQSAASTPALTVDPSRLGPRFALGAVGISLEADKLATPALRASHKSLVALMRQLGPAVLRLAGSSVDYSWWMNSIEQRPSWATSVITPAEIGVLRGLLAATGWRVILGIDLAHFDPARAANEARVVAEILGSHLLGFEVGNEPNGYALPLDGFRSSSYNASNYLDEVATYASAMRRALPGVRLYGPDLGLSSLQSWLPTIASSKSTSFVELTQHYYPTSYSVSRGICKGTPVPTSLELLSPQVRERESTFLQTIVRAGEIAHRRTRISETNDTSSCDASGGPDTSPVFASALWSLDWILRSASAGVAGINFHGEFGLCLPNTMSPVCSPSDAALARGEVVARPEYYGLLAARKLEGGRFVPLRMSGEDAAGDLTAYATLHPHARITLAVDNFATKNVSLTLDVPGYQRATSESLTAPSVSATRDVTLGHASVNRAGLLHPTPTVLSGTDGGLRIALAPTSAVVVTLYR